MKLWIGNLAPDTSDDELREFLKKYGIDTVASIERVEGDGSRPAAVVEVGATPEALMKATQRLNGMFWKGKTLVVQTITAR